MSSTTTTTTPSSSSIALAAAAAAAAAAATTLLLSAWSSKRRRATMGPSSPSTDEHHQQRIQELERLVDKWKDLRLAERNGRTRAEAKLRELQLAAQQQQAAAAASTPPPANASAPPPPPPPTDVWPMRPIGRLRSVFAGRNGTPRQPLRLAPSARAELQLSSWVPADALEGLDGYTHVWLIYAFHANTDAGKTAAKAGAGGAATTAATAPSSFRAKVHVPRLDGGRLGVLATRSPHRPCPIGLSAARLIAVLPGGRLLLGGADVVDGTPVLDVKPYVPFCDSVEGATAPAWVAAEAREEEEEPLRVAEVVVSSEAEAKLRQAWESVVRSAGGRRNKGSLYDEADEFLALVREVLARDIRAAHNRLRAKAKAAAAADAAENGGEEDEEEDLEGRWHVVLDGVDVSYAVDRAGRVLIRSAVPAAVAAKQRGGDDDDDETGG